SATQTIRCRFHPARSSLTLPMIAVSFSLPGNVQHLIGVPSRVTAIAMTTCGRSVRKSLECPKARFACSTGRVTPSSSTLSARSAIWSAPSTSQYVLVVSTKTMSRSRFEQVRDRGEHLGGDLVQRREQEVHPPVGLVIEIGR